MGNPGGRTGNAGDFSDNWLNVSIVTDLLSSSPVGLLIDRDKVFSRGILTIYFQVNNFKGY